MEGWIYIAHCHCNKLKTTTYFPSQTETQNTRQNSNLNEDISSPGAYGPKRQAVGQPPNENQQLLLRTRQLQLPQEEHRLTTATRERQSIGTQGRGGVSTSNSEFYSLLPSWSCSPEFNGIEEIHLCSFASTHSVAERHQGAGVQLTRTLLGWVQHGGEQRSQLAWKQWWPRHRRHRTGSVSQTYFSSLEMQVEFFKTRDVQYWLFQLNLSENL